MAGLAYFFLQSTPVNFELKKFIRHEPSLVFKFLKDPNYMTDIHPKVRNVYVESLEINSLNIEHRQYILTEDIPHIGHQNGSITSVADPNSLEITSKGVFMHGIVQVDLIYRLKEAWNGTIPGTSVEESTTMLIPYILVNFSNRTAIEIHTQILNNLEMLMDFAAGSENEDVFVDRAS